MEKHSSSCRETWPQLSHPNHYPPGSKGTRVSGVTYGKHVNYFSRYLIPFKQYKISNAALKPTIGSFKVSSYGCIWRISRHNLVELIHEDVPRALPCTLETTSFPDVFRFAEKQTSIYVKAIVVQSLGTREMSETASITELIIVNDEKVPMILTLWSSIEDEKPLIIALNVKATIFCGLSLSSKMSTYILVNPPLLEGNELRIWYNNHSEEIRQLIVWKSYDSSVLLVPPPHPADIMSVAAVTASIEVEKTMWTSGALRLQKGQKAYWFPTCSGCHKTVNGEIGWETSCPCCKQNTDIVARCRFAVFIRDSTAVIQAILFSPEAEKCIPFIGPELIYTELTGYPSHQTLAKKSVIKELCSF